jgi:D-glycero-alpha-D-manno-heptose-7-phosphate kinase
MILSRAPVRITLGGGGTDLPSYYSKHGGFLIAGGINKYVLVGANKQFFNTYRLKHSGIEEVKNIDQIKHNLFREAIKLLKVKPGVELTSISDVPSQSGLGSSGVFLVALLNTLHAYNGEYASKRELAEEACKIEMDILKETVGKQDQYMGAFGNITALSFDKNGKVEVEPVKLKNYVFEELENNIILFYTKVKRSSSQILESQDKKTKNKNVDTIDVLHKIKKIGIETKNALEKGDTDKLGEFLDDHWNLKKQLSKRVTNPIIDKWYKIAKENGALGGKIMGAGGGGFFLFYHSGTSKKKTDFIKKLDKEGLKIMRYRFDREGVKILVSTV